MRRSELLQGLRAMRFENIYGRFESGELSQSEAASCLVWGTGRSAAGVVGIARRERTGCGTVGSGRWLRTVWAMWKRTAWRRCIGSGIVGSRPGRSGGGLPGTQGKDAWTRSTRMRPCWPRLIPAGKTATRADT